MQTNGDKCKGRDAKKLRGMGQSVKTSQTVEVHNKHQLDSWVVGTTIKPNVPRNAVEAQYQCLDMEHHHYSKYQC